MKIQVVDEWEDFEQTYEALQRENERIETLQKQFDAESKDAHGKLKKMFGNFHVRIEARK